VEIQVIYEKRTETNDKGAIQWRWVGKWTWIIGNRSLSLEQREQTKNSVKLDTDPYGAHKGYRGKM